MTYKCYVKKNFKPATLEIIEQANAIIEDYTDAGMNLTLRQLYYQFVSRDLFENKMKNYTKLSTIISDARLAGLVSWDAIIDRTRELRRLGTWSSPSSIVGSCVRSYRIDKWENQDTVPEVWVEKEALLGVIEKPCNDLQVSYFACKGYTSQSEMYAGAMRLKDYIDDGKKVKIIHLGDHDPSGIDMTRDILDRMNLFLDDDLDFEIERIGLNYDQIERYAPPPNPAKFSDPRAKDYVKEFGTSSWELDALEPKVMRDLITDSINDVRDLDKWNESLEIEEAGRELLRDAKSYIEDLEE